MEREISVMSIYCHLSHLQGSRQSMHDLKQVGAVEHAKHGASQLTLASGPVAASSLALLRTCISRKVMEPDVEN